MTERTRDSSLISERYETRRIIMDVAGHLAVIMYELGALKYQDWAHKDPTARIRWDCQPHDEVQTILISRMKKHGHYSKDRRNRVSFNNFNYSSEGSIAWGKTKTLAEQALEAAGDDDWRLERDLRTDRIGFDETIRKSISLEDSISRSYTKEVELDMTTTASASGGYMGVNVSLEISVHAGISESRTQEMSHSTAKSVEKEYNFEWEPGDHVMITAEKRRTTSRTPYTVQGIRDFTTKLNFYNWTESPYLRGAHWDKHEEKEVTFNTFRDILRWLEGYDVRFPNMRKFIDNCSKEAYESIEWFRDSSNRMLIADGELLRIFDDDEKIVAEDVE